MGQTIRLVSSIGPAEPGSEEHVSWFSGRTSMAQERDGGDEAQGYYVFALPAKAAAFAGKK